MIAIAWLYVAFMMSITETSAVAGIMTFVFYGVIPLSVVLYIVDAPRRRKNRLIRAHAHMLAAQQHATLANPPEESPPS